MTPTEIKILLLKNNVTQSDIANKLNISIQAVSMVIQGAARSRRVQQAVADACNLNVKDIWPEGFVPRGRPKKLIKT